MKEYDCNCSFVKKGYLTNGWLQLVCEINSILLKEEMTPEMTANACLKETQYPWKKKIIASGLLQLPLKYMAANAPLK